MKNMSNNSQWNSIFTFILAMIGLTIGIGNIWRFSYILYSNGGGSFFIPYLIAICVMGIPFLILEYGLGFSFKKSFSNLMQSIRPEFEIIAWMLVLFVFIVVIYYMIILGWDFAYLLECLNFATRDAITDRLKINKAADTNRELIYRYLYALKDLRNAIAHNAVVFDARFRSFKPTKSMCDCLVKDVGVPYVNFKTIGDYLILMCYYLKHLGVGKKELRSFVRSFEKLTNDYRASVSPAVSSIVIHPDLTSRLQILKKFIG